MRRLLIVGLLMAAPAWAQDEPMPGQRVFGQCRSCHQVGPTAKNGVGPQLNGLFGRKAGGVEGFAYSAANKEAGFTWDEAVFAEYIRDPKAKIPGTRMVYAGLKNEAQAADLAAYLKSFKADGSQAR